MTEPVVIVGGGVAGLATAHRLLAAEPSLEPVVLEATDRAGGRLSMTAVGDLGLEAGPDAFVARRPWAVELCRELGLELEEPATAGALIWTEHGLVPMPATALGVPIDLDELARWPGLSKAGRARALADLVRKPRAPEGDESLGSLVRRRLGDEVAQALVGPLLGGLFAGDPDVLSVRATFPELAAWERDHGSLIRGAKAATEAAVRSGGPMFQRPVGGVTRLPSALVEAVGSERLRTGAAATGVAHEGDRWLVRAGAESLPAAAVVLATPAFASADLLTSIAPVAAKALGDIRYVSTGVVLLVYPEGTADALPDATGFVVPANRAPMTAATFFSRKWPVPAFGSRAVVRCFVGAAGSEDVLDAPDGDIVEAVCRHLAALVPLPDRAEASAIVRWRRSMPQYEVGHLDRVDAIERSLPPGMFVVGNAFRGVGVADTVRGANEVAERVLAHLAGDAEPIEGEHVR